MSIVSIEPATAERWQDLEDRFGPTGAYGHCWCTFFRRRAKDHTASTTCDRSMRGVDNKAELRRVTLEGRVPGLLAYDEDGPCGWVSVAPRGLHPLVAFAFPASGRPRRARRVVAGVFLAAAPAPAPGCGEPPAGRGHRVRPCRGRAGPGGLPRRHRGRARAQRRGLHGDGGDVPPGGVRPGAAPHE